MTERTGPKGAPAVNEDKITPSQETPLPDATLEDVSGGVIRPVGPGRVELNPQPLPP